MDEELPVVSETVVNRSRKRSPTSRRFGIRLEPTGTACCACTVGTPTTPSNIVAHSTLRAADKTRPARPCAAFGVWRLALLRMQSTSPPKTTERIRRGSQPFGAQALSRGIARTRAPARPPVPFPRTPQESSVRRQGASSGDPGASRRLRRLVPSRLSFVESTKSANIANRIGNSPIERRRPERFISDCSPQRSDVVVHVY